MNNDFKKVQVNSFVKVNDMILRIMTQGNKSADSTAIDIYCHLLNDLSFKYNEGTLEDNYSLEFELDEISKMINKKPLQPAKRVQSMRAELKEADKPYTMENIVKLIADNQVFGIRFTEDDIEYFPMFNLLKYFRDSKVLRISYNEIFIQNLKRSFANTPADKFDKLYLDIMLSLTHIDDKVLFTQLSCHNRQMHEYQATSYTNIDLENDIIWKRNAVYSKEGTPNMTMTINAINKSLDRINKIIVIKNEQVEEEHRLPQYQLETKRGGTRCTQYTQYRFTALPIIQYNPSNIDEMVKQYRSEYKKLYKEVCPNKRTQCKKIFDELAEKYNFSKTDYTDVLNKVLDWMKFWNNSDWEKEKGHFNLNMKEWMRNKLDSHLPFNDYKKQPSYGSNVSFEGRTKRRTK